MDRDVVEANAAAARFFLISAARPSASPELQQQSLNIIRAQSHPFRTCARGPAVFRIVPHTESDVILLREELPVAVPTSWWREPSYPEVYVDGKYGFLLPEDQIIPSGEETLPAAKVLAHAVLEAGVPDRK